MSERKSAEIKLRCTPSFKAGVQAAASAADQTLTEYVEAAVWAHQNAKLDGTALVGNAIEALRELGAGESAAVARLECCAGHPVNAGSACDDCPATGEKDGALGGIGAWVHPNLQPLDAPADDAAPCGCRPWEFCTHKASA